MDKELHEKFIEIAKEKISDKTNVASVLADLLSIKKEAIYRRLRGEVFFSFAEMVIIGRKLDISLDHVAGMVSPYRSHLFFLHVENFVEQEEIDYRMTADYIASIRRAGSLSYSEYGYTTTIIPLHFSVFHEPFYYLYILKWMYQTENYSTLLFSEISFSERQKKLNAQFLQEVMAIKYTYYIWDELFLTYMLNDINYFYSIHLMSDADMRLMKKEIEYFLTRLEKLAVQGAYPNGNKVEIYVSSLNFETTYYYLSSDIESISMISSFSVGAVTSLEKSVCEQMKTWMHALKRTSTLISCSADKDRISFFEKQRMTLNTFFDRHNL
ncbi:MAG: hypothetical protein LBJ01_05570 [Tannerella sp.]|jgi:hypothetical protein|nr:hypothetical protein [Tannerella sp.]